MAVAAAATNTTLVAAVASKRIRVVQLVLVASGGALSVKLQSATAGTDLTGAMALAATTGQLVLPNNPAGWCQTVAGELLNLNCSATTAVGGVLGYVTVE